MNNKINIVLLMFFLLSGCGSTAFLEQKNKAIKSDTEIKYNQNKGNELYISAPPVDLIAIAIKKEITWADKIPFSMKSKKIRLSDLLLDVSRRTGTTIYFGRDTNSNIPIRVNVNGNLTDFAKNIEEQTTYKLDLSETNVISVLAWQTKTYSLFNLVGSHEYMIGKDSDTSLDEGQDSDTDASSGALFNADQAQYANIKSDSSSEIDDTIAVIRNMIGKYGTVSANKASGSITVITKPRIIRDIDIYINAVNNMYGKMVRIKVKIITFQSEKNNSFGIDWNLVKTSTNGILNFASKSNGGVVDSLEELGSFSYTATGGKFDGSTVLINALKEQGNVALVTEPTMMVLNNRVGEIESLHKEAYVKDISIPTSSGDDDNSFGDVTQGIVSEGFSMRALVKIIKDDILMQLSITVSKLGTFGVVETPTIQIKTPNMTEERFNQPIRVKNGRTIILSGYSQSTTRSGEKESFENPLTGGNSGKDKKSQTIVLLTPVIIN